MRRCAASWPSRCASGACCSPAMPPISCRPPAPKGLNLAASDVYYLSQALVEFYKQKSSGGLDHYSARALARVWKAERFSWWMTTLLHTFPDQAFEAKMQLAELDYIFNSRSAATALAENYVGLPL